jgi:hypothetical protein
MNNFNDGAPRTPQEWEDLGYVVIPCNTEGVPTLKGWKEDFKTKPSDFKSNVIGLRLDNNVDLDIDNPIMQKFLGDVICGAKFGRKSNPLSHLLFEGVTEYEEVIVPVAFDKYFKNFPHGRRLLDIRHGNDHFTYVPGGFRPHKKNAGAEVLDWLNFTGFQKYDTRTNALMKEICLKTALSIMFPSLGQIDNYVSSIAGILAKHTDWQDEKINTFCFDLAFKSGSSSPGRYANKGTAARDDKTKSFGIPKLAEILEVTPSDVAKLFSWVGVKDASTMFTDLVVYNTEPKQWRLKFKDNWIDIWDTSILLSYTKMKILILENCLVEPPEIKPNDWKVIRTQLLANIKKEEAPPESSYYGMVTGMLIEFLKRKREHQNDDYDDKRFNLLDNIGCAYHENYYWVKTEAVIKYLKIQGQSIDVRKVAHLFRTQFGAENTKITIQKKEIRCWKIPRENVEGARADNTGSDKQFIDAYHEHIKKKEERLGHSIYGKKDNY